MPYTLFDCSSRADHRLPCYALLCRRIRHCSYLRTEGLFFVSAHFEFGFLLPMCIIIAYAKHSCGFEQYSNDMGFICNVFRIDSPPAASSLTPTSPTFSLLSFSFTLLKLFRSPATSIPVSRSWNRFVSILMGRWSHFKLCWPHAKDEKFLLPTTFPSVSPVSYTRLHILISRPCI
jgi:hypothetical protein